MGTHYTNFVTDIKETNRFASWAAITIAQLCDGKRPILIFSGLSGMTLGMSVAMALLRDQGIEAGTYIVRKPTETTRAGGKPHPVTRSENTHFGGDIVPFFIDDGIDAGTTYNFCVEKWRAEYGGLSGRPDAIPVVCRDWLNPYHQHLMPPYYKIGDVVHTEYDKRTERRPAPKAEIPDFIRAEVREIDTGGGLFDELRQRYGNLEPKSSGSRRRTTRSPRQSSRP